MAVTVFQALVFDHLDNLSSTGQIFYRMSFNLVFFLIFSHG